MKLIASSPTAKGDVVFLHRMNKDKEFILNSHTVQDYINDFYDFVQIYPDASKISSNQVGVAFNVPHFQIKAGNRVNMDSQRSQGKCWHYC